MKRRIAQAALTVTLLVLVVLFVDIRHMFQLLRQMNFAYGVLALGLLFVQNDLATRRWAAILKAFGNWPGYFRLLRIQYAALFAQLFLPTSVGAAAVRAGLLFKYGTPFGIALNSVVIDRIVALGGLVLLASFFMPAIAASLSIGAGAREVGLVAVLTVAVLALVVYAALRIRPFSFWLDLVKRTPARHFVEPIEQSASRIWSPARVLTVFTFSLTGQIVAIGAIFVLAKGSGLNVRLIDCILVMPPVMLLSALPISIAGWGIRESAMVVGFGLLGVSREAAFALSIQFAILGYIAAAPGALAWIEEAGRKNRNKHSTEPSSGDLG
jgi:glycosyltransferase 2 family protein